MVEKERGQRGLKEDSKGRSVRRPIVLNWQVQFLVIVLGRNDSANELGRKIWAIKKHCPSRVGTMTHLTST